MKDPVYTLVCAIGVCAVLFTYLMILEWRYSEIDAQNQEIGALFATHGDEHGRF